MNNEDILVILLGVVIVGIGWLVWKFSPKKYRYLAPFIVAAGPIFVLIRAPSLKEYVIGITALIGVFIAVLSLDQSAGIRRDTSEKEQRDRNDRLLDEILDWARRVGYCPADVNSENELSKLMLDGKASESQAENFLREHRAQWLMKYKDVNWQNAYILNIATRFGDELFRPTNELIDRLKGYNDILQSITWKDMSKKAKEVAIESSRLNLMIENLMQALSVARIKNRPVNK